MMTVAELRKALVDMPDDDLVYVKIGDKLTCISEVELLTWDIQYPEDERFDCGTYGVLLHLEQTQTTA